MYSSKPLHPVSSLLTSREYNLLKVLCICVFVGRAWQHLFWDIPLREFLWDQQLLEGIVQFITGSTWQAYVTNPATDSTIQWIIRGLGVGCIAVIFATIFVQRNRRWTGVLLSAGGIYLTLLALLYWKEKFLAIGQFMEYTIQWMTPLLLYYVVFRSPTVQRVQLALKIAIALTFAGHGFYALGWHPVPGHFTEMLITIFGVSESGATLILQVAGILDIVAAIGIFIPRVQRPMLIYCIIWGTLTALARIVANVYIDFFWQSLHQWWYEMLFRLPHGGLPLLLYWMVRRK